jgi:adenylate cyclase
MISRNLQRLPLVAAALAIVASGGVLVLRASGALESSELALHDRLLRFARPASEEDPRVVLVQVTERDIQELGHPLPDAVLAQALRALAAAEVRAVGVDLYRDRPVPPGSEELERAVLASPGVVMIEKAGGDDEDSVPAPDYVEGTGQVGFSDVMADRDGRLRRGLLMMHRDGVGGLSLAARLAFRYLAFERISPRWARSADEADPTPLLELGDVALPRFAANDGSYVDADAGGYQVLLAHPRGRTSFASYALRDLLAGSVAPDALRDRVVVLGSTAASVRDLHATPFGAAFGIEHHAGVTSELLDRSLGRAAPLRFLGDLPEGLLIVLCGALAAISAARIRSPWGLGALGLCALGLLVVGSLALFQRGWWVPALPAGLAFAGSGALALAWESYAQRRERQLVMELFGRFLPREVADSIWNERDSFLEGGRPRARLATITVMMTDLVGYTTISESLDAQRLMEWIDGYLEAMARLVGAHGGVVDDYMGDGIKADFGVPVPRSRESEVSADARAAVECALAMEAEVERLNRRWMQAGYPPARVRIGLHTGPAVVGVVGGTQRLKFTSIGDSVNTAARLETYRSEDFRAEDGLLRLLVSDETFRRLGGGYEAEELGKVVLKGKAEPVLVYRIRVPVRTRGEES